MHSSLETDQQSLHGDQFTIWTIGHTNCKEPDLHEFSYTVSDHSFSPYLTITKIIEWFVCKFQHQYPFYTRKLEDTSVSLLSEWKNTDLSSDSVLYSVIRRISRETMVTARWIDKLASQLADLITRIYLNEHNAIVVNISNAEWIDRP